MAELRSILTEAGESDLPAEVSAPKITTDEEYDALEMGAKYLAPNGNLKQKPYEVKFDIDYESVPEGAFFRTPEGNVKQKHVTEGLDLTTQTLYDMAYSEKEKQNVLGRVAGKEKVKQDPFTGEFYVDMPNNTRVKPGAGNILKRGAAFVGAEAAPIGFGAVEGFLGASRGGAIGGPPGAIAGALTGWALGTATGRAFNDSILQLAGVYDRTPQENIKALAHAAAYGAGGEGAFRVVAKFAPNIASVLNYVAERVPEMGPRILAKFVGATQVPEQTKLALQIAEKGGKPPPSSYMPESPYIKKVVEEFDPIFRQQMVMARANEDYYLRAVNEILDKMGVPQSERATWRKATLEELRRRHDEGAAKMPGIFEEVDKSKLFNSEEKQQMKDVFSKLEKDMRGGGISEEGSPISDINTPVSSRKAGEALIQRVHRELGEADAALSLAAADARQVATESAGQFGERQQKALAALAFAEKRSRAAADAVIKEGYNSIRADITAASKAAAAGENPGDLVKAVAGKFRSLRAAIGARATKNYNAADAAAGDAIPNIGELPELAAAFEESLPEVFRAKHPEIVRSLKNLGGKMEEVGGEIIQNTFGQLRQLRTLLRNDIDYTDLTPSSRDGVFKYFQNKLDGVLHDAEAVPALKEAAKLLDNADSFYAKNIKAFKNENVKWTVKQLEDGLPADPEALAKMIFRPEQTEAIRKIRRMVGKNYWSAIEGSNTNLMLRNSQTLVPGEIDGLKFATQVLDMQKNGTLNAAYGAEAGAKLLKQAQQIFMVEGKLSLEAMPGDTVASVLRRAEKAATAAKDLAKADPIGTLQKELAAVDKQYSELTRAAKLERSQDPFNFLHEANAPAIESANRILSNPDLIMASAKRFGETSKEFTLLRWVYAQRLLQHHAKPLKGALPEIQELMFPGVSLKDARTLAEHMDFLSGGMRDVGGYIAAQSRVLNPWGAILGSGAKFVPAPLRVDAVGRYLLTQYYAFVSWGATHPGFIKMLVRGLEEGGPSAIAIRAEARKVIPGLGGAVGESLYQGFRSPDQPEQKAAPMVPWRQELQGAAP